MRVGLGCCFGSLGYCCLVSLFLPRSNSLPSHRRSSGSQPSSRTWPSRRWRGFAAASPRAPGPLRFLLASRQRLQTSPSPCCHRSPSSPLSPRKLVPGLRGSTASGLDAEEYPKETPLSHYLFFFFLFSLL